MKRAIWLERDLLDEIHEILPRAMTLEDWAVAMIRGSVAEFWTGLTPDGVLMSHMRERVRAFMREGDGLDQAIRKARLAYAKEGRP